MTVSNLPRPVPAAPAGASFVSAQQAVTGLTATPFAIGTQANISKLSIVNTGRTGEDGRMTVALFAAGANGRPSGAALASATINFRDGVFGAALTAPIDPPAGDYFAVTSFRPGSIAGAPMFQSIRGGDFAVAEMIGSTNPAAPCSGLALSLVDTDWIDITGATLSGAEPWAEITNAPGGPVVWLS